MVERLRDLSGWAGTVVVEPLHREEDTLDKVLFPNGLFPPSTGDLAQRFTGVRADETLSVGLRIVAFDSDPFYGLALFLDGVPAAIEYSGDYRDRIAEIAANPQLYRAALRRYIDETP